MAETKIQKILNEGDKDELRALFGFSSSNTEEEVLLKFNLWGRHFLPGHYVSPDAYFHEQMDSANYRLWTGRGTVTEPDVIDSSCRVKFFLNSAFRGAAKDTRTKLWLAFAILNDEDKSKKYIKILTKDGNNATQLVTDVFNILVLDVIQKYYPEVLEKTAKKREESRNVFTTSTDIQVRAFSMIKDQRGQQQGAEETARPDLIIMNDFETRITLASAVITQKIWLNMEEAKTGLALKGGSIAYLCNHVSEKGNVHKLFNKVGKTTYLLDVPIITDEGVLSWPEAHTHEHVEQLREDTDDFEGEYLNKPSAGPEIYFDRETLEDMKTKLPVKTVSDFKMFYKYNPSRKYGAGHDVAGGVGLDSSTSVFIDFSCIPKKVVATYKSNTISPEHFGDEIARQGRYYGECIVAPEKNNHGHATIGRLKQVYSNIYVTKQKKVKAVKQNSAPEFGWHTNAVTKGDMISALKDAVEKGELQLTDPDLVQELKDYTRNDLIDRDEDIRLTTRHFDLLIACAIAWQTKDDAQAVVKKKRAYVQPAYESPGLE